MIEKLKASAGPWYATILETVLSKEGAFALLLAFMIYADARDRKAISDVRQATSADTHRLIEAIERDLETIGQERKKLLEEFDGLADVMQRLLEER